MLLSLSFDAIYAGFGCLLASLCVFVLFFPVCIRSLLDVDFDVVAAVVVVVAFFALCRFSHSTQTFDSFGIFLYTFYYFTLLRDGFVICIWFSGGAAAPSHQIFHSTHCLIHSVQHKRDVQTIFGCNFDVERI